MVCNALINLPYLSRFMQDLCIFVKRSELAKPRVKIAIGAVIELESLLHFVKKETILVTEKPQARNLNSAVILLERIG